MSPHQAFVYKVSSRSRIIFFSKLKHLKRCSLSLKESVAALWSFWSPSFAPFPDLQHPSWGEVTRIVHNAWNVAAPLICVGHYKNNLIFNPISSLEQALFAAISIFKNHQKKRRIWTGELHDLQLHYRLMLQFHPCSVILQFLSNASEVGVKPTLTHLRQCQTKSRAGCLSSRCQSIDQAFQCELQQLIILKRDY